MKTASSFIRYPGSKAKLANRILDRFPAPLMLSLWQQNRSNQGKYVEPFVGAGAIAAKVLSHLPRSMGVLLNDRDYWLVCMWKSVLEEPKELCRLIEDFEPAAEAFYAYKEQDGDMIDPLEAGFRKLALHQMSYSGLGCKAGGPLGGREQTNTKYNPQCRWRPANLKQRIVRLSLLLKRFASVEITCRSFEEALKRCVHGDFVYLDPPYFQKGSQLYKYSMSNSEHSRLAQVLRNARYQWMLSYDDHARIRALYNGWCTIEPLQVVYTTATSRDGKQRPKNHEILIYPS